MFRKSGFRILFALTFIGFIPVFLYGMSVWSWMWRSVGLREGEVCARSFQAVDKGTFWERGEWHHYVDFNVDVVTPENYHWRVVQAPMPTSVFRRYSEEYVLRATYRWPDNWWDPFPLERWELCLVDT